MSAQLPAMRVIPVWNTLARLPSGIIPFYTGLASDRESYGRMEFLRSETKQQTKLVVVDVMERKAPRREVRQSILQEWDMNVGPTNKFLVPITREMDKLIQENRRQKSTFQGQWIDRSRRRKRKRTFSGGTRWQWNDELLEISNNQPSPLHLHIIRFGY